MIYNNNWIYIFVGGPPSIRRQSCYSHSQIPARTWYTRNPYVDNKTIKYSPHDRTNTKYCSYRHDKSAWHIHTSGMPKADDRWTIKSADFVRRQKIGRLLYVTQPILSADISAIYLTVELILISPIISGNKIGRFYRSSVIGLTLYIN